MSNNPICPYCKEIIYPDYYFAHLINYICKNHDNTYVDISIMNNNGKIYYTHLNHINSGYDVFIYVK
jgi:hypothetical protein